MNKTQKFTSLLLGSALLLSGAIPAMAQTTAGAAGTGSSTRKADNQAARMTMIKDRANKELDRRIDALNKLSTRINAMKHVSATDKSSLSTTISSQVSTLGDLKTKIAADTDITTLRTDVQSITKSYRIFALVLPEGAIMAAADRVIDVANSVTSGIQVKLQSRIDAAKAAGNDVTTVTATMSDLAAKLADATKEAQAAIAQVSVLTPDNGDKTKMDANTAALKDARSKVKTGMADLKSVRADARSIIAALKGMKHPKATTSSTTSGTAD